jgi:hypothetical protein
MVYIESTHIQYKQTYLNVCSNIRTVWELTALTPEVECGLTWASRKNIWEVSANPSEVKRDGVIHTTYIYIYVQGSKIVMMMIIF